jgi:hypothetical protein
MSMTASLPCRGIILLLLACLSACSSVKSAGTQVDDAAITAKVKAKLAADGDINPFNIDVDANNGVVTLQGRVAKAEGRQKAEELARNTDGVRRVINLVKVGDDDGTGGSEGPCYPPKCKCQDGSCKESCCVGGIGNGSR